METLAGYIGWMGDYSFEACPFREADALVLCLIAYFDLSPVFADGKRTAHVRDCAQMVDAGEAKLLITGGDLGNTEIFTAAVRSRRFGDLEITDAVDVLQENPPLQFAAVTFHDGSNFSFIAYRGTDSSLAGWKENFMISFTRTAAQEMALQYASERIAEYRLAGKRKWYIGGHSKGGNLALYASCMLADEDLLAVDRVFLLDGPGLCPEVLDAKLVKRIDSRATMITPEYDIIGSIFSPEIADSRIIRSYRDGIVQHSLASWLVDHGDLALAERHSLFSDRLCPNGIGIAEGVDADARGHVDILLAVIVPTKAAFALDDGHIKAFIGMRDIALVSLFDTHGFSFLEVGFFSSASTIVPAPSSVISSIRIEWGTLPSMMMTFCTPL